MTAWVVVTALFILCPVITLAVMASQGSFEGVLHIAMTVLASATLQTAILLLGVGLMTATMGSVTAWLVTFYEFPGRRVFAWLVVLPLAVPTYLAAYAFVEFLDFTGPVQSVVRSIGGYSSSRDYWFVEPQSLGGAIVILALVLYPYVYLAVRALFAVQDYRVVEAARTLGASDRPLFLLILMPLARPGIAIGVILVLMETLNDIGAVEYLGVQTLTLSIYSLWLNQGDIAGATQIAVILCLIVFCLVIAERRARQHRCFHNVTASSGNQQVRAKRLRGAPAAAAFAACVMPPALGLGVPLFVFGGYAWRRLDQLADARLLEAMATSVTLGITAAVITLLIAIFLSYCLRFARNPVVPPAVRLACIGYAMPGTVIALGVLIPLAALDNGVDAFMREHWGISTGLLLTGSGAAIIYAYVVRFMAIAEGAIDGGFRKLTPSLDMTAQLLGRDRFKVLREVLIPLIRPAMATALLLVFIDSIKELSATILLRPFGLNTLSTHVYEFASMGRVEDAGLAACAIILTSTVAAILMAGQCTRKG